MEFKFLPDHLTMFDDRASAIFDTSSKCKAIAKRDMLLFDEGFSALVINDNESLSVPYTLVERWIPLDKISISFSMVIDRIGQMDLLTLKHGGYVRLLHEKVQMHFVTENGEFDLDISTDYASGKETQFTIQRDGDRMRVSFGIYHSDFELPDNCRSGLEVMGFFGEISDTTARVSSISIQPYAAEVAEAAQTKVEQIKARLAAVNEELKRLDEPKEPSVAVEFNEISFPLIRSVLPSLIGQKVNDTMSETIEAYIQRITGLKLEDIKAMDRKALIRAVYNGIANDPTTAHLNHHEVLKEAHYSVARFLDGDQSIPVPTITVGNSVYNTFEFGEINKTNCTPDKLLYLVKTYPEVWLKRLA